MKYLTLSIIIGIIIIAIVAWFAMRSGSQNQIAFAPTTTPTVATQDSSGLIQLAPTSTPVVSPSLETSAIPVAVTVFIDDEGYSPAIVTVKEGTTVTFVNNGQAFHWPASDPHPIHTGLPGLDALKGLSTGETYLFTFTKSGTFGIHDHLNTQFKATIVVQ